MTRCVSTRSLILLGLALTFTSVACKADPPIAYQRLGGPSPLLPAVEGHAIVLSFWASWCKPCVAETPALHSLAADPPEGLVVVVVPVESDPEQLGRLLPPGGPVVVLPNEPEKLQRALGVETLPAAFLVVEGRLVARFNGSRDWQSAEMRRLLSKLIVEQTQN